MPPTPDQKKGNTKPFVRMHTVDKRWGGQLGVEDISLSVDEGQFVALLGPSGCGKSTTLRLLAGLEFSDKGTIEIDGVDVTGLPAAERNLSMVFQNYALFPHLSVAENVIFGLKVRKTPEHERDTMLAKALEITGLTGLENRKPNQLSGGQRQRVALARAIVAGRKLCLMDEPLSNLDAKLRYSVRKDIKKLQQSLGMTVIYVTHDQAEAMSMADVIVLMKEGTIQQVGTPADIYNNPINTFVAKFVGSPPMALIEGGALKKTKVKNPHTIAIRPEYITLSTKAKGDLTCTVQDVEYLGSETLVELHHANASGLVVKLQGEQTLEIGAQVAISFDKDKMLFYDRDGNRI